MTKHKTLIHNCNEHGREKLEKMPNAAYSLIMDDTSPEDLMNRMETVHRKAAKAVSNH